MDMGNWKVEWKDGSRMFADRLAAERFADSLRNRYPEKNPHVSYTGPSNHMTATFAVSPL